MKVISTLLFVAMFLSSMVRDGNAYDFLHKEAGDELSEGWEANGETGVYVRGEKSWKGGNGGNSCKCPTPKPSCRATIAIANRNSGTLSVLDADTGRLLKTVPMPRKESEPMYVTAINGRVYVGDRAHDEIVVFDATQYYKVIKILPGGKGIFHMHADQAGTILWVNNNVDKTITIYDIVNLQPIKTIPIPQDIVDGGGKPHDLTISFDGKFAFVTVVGLEDDGVLLKYDTSTYEMVGRRDDLAKDPHVGLTFRNNKLYVAQQAGDKLSILNRDDLTDIASVDIPDAHGVLMFSSNDKVVYVTDISDAQDDEVGIYAIDLNTNGLLGNVTTDIPPTPHNIVGTGEKLFISHSGATNNLVTVYTASVDNPIPVKIKTVEVGLNPFGLDFVESTCAYSDIYW